MNKKYILSKAIFASALAAGLLAGTLAFEGSQLWF